MEQDEIEDTLSRTPLLEPPKDIYVLKNGIVYSPTFFEQYPFVTIGMTPSDRSKVILTRESGIRNLIHETLHYNGMNSEATVRPLARLFELRSRFNLGIFKQNVRYEKVPMTLEEKQNLMHLSSRTTIQPVNVSLENAEIEHYVLVSD